MTTEDNKAIVRRFIEEVFNKKNLAFVDEYAAPNAVDHGVPPGMPAGPEGSKQYIGMFLSAFPDLHAHVDDMIAEGDKVVTRSSYHGTQTGPLMGIPASGKTVSTTAIDITRLANGRSVEHWLQLDLLSILQQVGAVPTPGAGGK